MNTNLKKTVTPDMFDFARVGLLDKRDPALPMPTVDTFLFITRVNWTFAQVWHGFICYLTQASGDVLNLGSGSWIYAGTATGVNRHNQPCTVGWNFDYDVGTDALKITALGYTRQFESVTKPTAELQLKQDVNGNPTLIVARADLQFTPFGGEFSYFITNGSFLLF